MELVGPLYFDFFNQDRHLISLVPMRIKLIPNRPEFIFNSYATKPKDFKIKFEKVVLFIERLVMNPSVINGHAVGLKTQNAHYFVNHTDVLTKRSLQDRKVPLRIIFLWTAPPKC